LPNGKEILLKDNSTVIVKGKDSVLINNSQKVDVQYKKSKSNDENKFTELIVPYGKKTFLTLNDSTKVWLCAGSRLAFPTVFTDKKREIYLEGEAYFEVAHDANKPFIVNTGAMFLSVLGTRFYVSANPSDEKIVTVLIDGKVVINEKTTQKRALKETVLKPGEKAIYSKNSKILDVKQAENLDFYIAWTEGWFLFSKEDLITVFKKLERYYNVKFIFDKSFHSDDLITGKLDLKDSVSDVLIILSEISNLSFKIEDDNNIFIENKPK